MKASYDRNRITICIALLALLGTTFFLLHPAIHGPFVFDDFPNLSNLQQLGDRLDRVSIGRYLAVFNGNPGRPLATLSFLIEDHAWPTSPLSFKRDNLLLHMLVGVLIFGLARSLAYAQSRLSHHADLFALIVAALWLLHPLQLSATMLVVQRMAILCTAFIVAGLWAYASILSNKSMAEFSRVIAAGSLLAFFGTLALLSKENGVLIFAYATALNLTLLNEHVRALRPWPRRLLQWGTATPMLGLAVVAAWHLRDIAARYIFRDFTLSERLLTQAHVLLDYLRQILLPRVGEQGIFHDDYPIARGLLDPSSTLLCIIVIVVLVFSALRWRRQWPVIAFAILWFFSGQLIESTIVPLELYFDHRNYLPMLGPLFAVAAIPFMIPVAYRALGLVILMLWGLLEATMSASNAHTWGDRETLATVWLQERPRSVRAIQFMASAQYDRGNVHAALDTLERGYRTVPGAGELGFQIFLANCLSRGVTPDQTQSLQTLAITVHYAGVIPHVVTSLRKEVLGQRCHGTFGEADLENLVQRLIHNPEYAEDDRVIGYFHYELSKLALAHRDLNRLMYELDESYRLRPEPSVAREQAIYLLTAGLPNDALRYLDISDNTPRPLIKRWLYDVQAANMPLRQSALRMRERLSRDKR